MANGAFGKVGVLALLAGGGLLAWAAVTQGDGSSEPAENPPTEAKELSAQKAGGAASESTGTAAGVALKPERGYLRVNAEEPVLVLMDGKAVGDGKNIFVDANPGDKVVAVFPVKRPPQFHEVNLTKGQERSLNVDLSAPLEPRWNAAKDPKEPLHWVIHAKECLHLKRYYEAEVLLRMALKKQPREWDWWRDLVAALMPLNKVEAASNAIDRYLRITPGGARPSPF